MFGVPAIPMTKPMIDEVVEAYADTARKLVAWGIEGVEVHAGHGNLPAQFLTPAMNDRSDDYGEGVREPHPLPARSHGGGARCRAQGLSGEYPSSRHPAKAGVSGGNV